MMTLEVLSALLAIGSAFVSSILVKRFEWWAQSHHVLDVPNERSSHRRPIPRGAGVSIAVITVTGVVLVALTLSSMHWMTVLTYLVTSALIAVVSWLDDLHSLPTLSRFFVQFGVTLASIWGFGWWESLCLHIFPNASYAALCLLLIVLWIVGLTNAFNFMDGIDGIAGGQAVVAGLGLLSLGLYTRNPLLAVAAALLMGSTLGFLKYNWSPARVFMGDVGSAFLGFSFAVLVLLGARDMPVALLAGALFLWPSLADTAFTLLRRLVSGENIFQAHRSHLYQRLVIAGYSHQFVALLYGGLATVGLVLAVPMVAGYSHSEFASVLIVSILFIGLLVLTVISERLKKQESV